MALQHMEWLEARRAVLEKAAKEQESARDTDEEGITSISELPITSRTYQINLKLQFLL